MIFEELEPCDQGPISTKPYDWWGIPDRKTIATFYRLEQLYLVRITDQADFLIDLSAGKVQCRPTEAFHGGDCESFYFNSIRPLIENYLGGLNLHGSAVVNKGVAIAFVGESRRGKTTLAAALARKGFPFLTEDCLTLERELSRYMVVPTRPVMRLFDDSATELGIGAFARLEQSSRSKGKVNANDAMPFQDHAAPLGKIYFLGSGSCEKIVIKNLDASTSLSRFLQHSLILDVDDKRRLHSHFNRLQALAETVPCFELDFPRRFEDLPAVLEAILGHTMSLGGSVAFD